MNKFDIAIIGGGINGCGIARDAAGRGLSVLLVEKHDLASGTSSKSTKLIHGGLRYLETYEFSLVRESLIEREVLWSIAPHIIHPLRFVLPHHKGLRPAWFIRLGLFLYDHIGGRKRLPPVTTLNLAKDPAGIPLKKQFKKAFEYSDCRVDDARLVVLNARDAADLGADIRVGTQLVSAHRENDCWQLELEGENGSQTVAARVLVNAAGPWVGEVVNNRIRNDNHVQMRLVRGSHIVVPCIYEHDRAYIFQNRDGRIVFAIPYLDKFTLIGTTDIDTLGDPDADDISAQETEYLCAAISTYFAKPVTPQDVVWAFGGIRPLFDDGEKSAQKVTRDFVLDLETAGNGAPLLNIFGGKITTYRRLAIEALEKLEDYLGPLNPDWTHKVALPGGDFAIDDSARELQKLVSRYPFLPDGLARRLFETYGTMAHDILADCNNKKKLGVHFGAGLYQREVEYLASREWARTADDILWRRTKLGLVMPEAGQRKLADWLRQKHNS